MDRESSSEKPRRGGARAGAGRKKNPRNHDSPHATRPSLSRKHPVHVVLRVMKCLPRLRQRDTYRAIRRTLTRYLGRDDFRVVHVSIQHNHLHLLVEAENRRVLSRVMQGFAINMARAINQSFKSWGKVFAHRYHATQIQTPFHARHALAYVLNNWRRHREDRASVRTLDARLDPCASGMSFTGWAGGQGFECPEGYIPLLVSPARTSLLASEWRKHGLIDLFETPGPTARW